MRQPLEWSDLWAAMDEKPEEWMPTTKNMYWQMLECLPPRAQRGDAFLVGEAKTHTAAGAIYACFRQAGDAYFAKHMTLAQFCNNAGVAA